MKKILVLFVCMFFTNFFINIKASPNDLYEFKWTNTFIEVPVGLDYYGEHNYNLKPTLTEVIDKQTNKARNISEFEIKPTSDYYDFYQIRYNEVATYQVMFRATHVSDPDCFSDVLVKYKVSDKVAPALLNEEITKKTIELNVGEGKLEAKDFILNNFKPQDNYSKVRSILGKNPSVKPVNFIHEEILGYNLVNVNKVGLYPYKYILTDGSGNKKEYSGEINVVDEKAPTITPTGKRLEVVKGEIINISDYFTIEDNYDKKVLNISVEPKIVSNDVENVVITAIDSNNNKTTLNVAFQGLRKKAKIILKAISITVDTEEFNILEKIKANIARFENVSPSEESLLEINHNLGNNPYLPNKYYAYLKILNSDEYKIEVNVVDEKGPAITKIEPDKEIIYQYNETVLLNEFLKLFRFYDDNDKENVDVVVTPREIKTNKLGLHEVEIKASDKKANYNKYMATYKVVDNEKPVIKQMLSSITLYEDEFIDYKKYFNVSDNHSIKDSPFLEKTIYNEPGIFYNKITAIDFSNNKEELIFSIEILEKAPTITLKEKKLTLNIYDKDYEKEILYNVLRIDNNKHNYTLDDIAIKYDNTFDINKICEGYITYYIKNKNNPDEMLTKIDCKVIVKDLLGPSAHQKVSEIKIPVFTKTFSIYDYFTIQDNTSSLEEITVKEFEGKLNLKEVGYYYLKYLLLDKNKNENYFSFTVNVIDDQAPEINIEKLEYKTNINERINFKKLISVKDNYSKKIYLSIEDHNVNYKEPGEYMVKVIAKDEANNESFIELKIEVIDNIIPQIKLVSNYLEHEIGTTPKDLAGNITEVVDNLTKLSLANINIEHNIDYTYPGYYEIIYSVKDDGGNIAIEQAKIFVHYKDKPKLELIKNSLDTKDLTADNIIKNLKVLNNRNCEYELASDISLIKHQGSYDIKLLVKDELGQIHENYLTINVTNKTNIKILSILIPLLLILCGGSILTTFIILKKKYKRNKPHDNDKDLYEQLEDSLQSS